MNVCFKELLDQLRDKTFSMMMITDYGVLSMVDCELERFKDRLVFDIKYCSLMLNTSKIQYVVYENDCIKLIVEGTDDLQIYDIKDKK